MLGDLINDEQLASFNTDLPPKIRESERNRRETIIRLNEYRKKLINKECRVMSGVSAAEGRRRLCISTVVS